MNRREKTTYCALAVGVLIRENELARVTEALKREGCFESSSPWAFKDSKLPSHRFMKVEGEEA